MGNEFIEAIVCLLWLLCINENHSFKKKKLCNFQQYLGLNLKLKMTRWEDDREQLHPSNVKPQVSASPEENFHSKQPLTCAVVHTMMQTQADNGKDTERQKSPNKQKQPLDRLGRVDHPTSGITQTLNFDLLAEINVYLLLAPHRA